MISVANVRHAVKRNDMTNLPFKDAEYDFIFASHVLEHIQDDLTAISEIRRVLKPERMSFTSTNGWRKTP